MGRVKTEMFMGTELEKEIDSEACLNEDPEYIEWSEKLDEQFNEQFKDFEGAEGTVPF